MKFTKKTIAVGVATVFAVGGIGTFAAHAAIPNSTTHQYSVCLPNVGTLKTAFFIDKEAGTNCPAGYTEKTWNQAGPAGPPGPAGPVGPAGNYIYQKYGAAGSESSVPVGTIYTNETHCPDGLKVLTGGFQTVSSNAVPVQSSPTDDNTGWIVKVRVVEEGPVGVETDIICSNFVDTTPHE